jgi:hypothetical protein
MPARSITATAEPAFSLVENAEPEVSPPVDASRGCP